MSIIFNPGALIGKPWNSVLHKNAESWDGKDIDTSDTLDYTSLPCKEDQKELSLNISFSKLDRNGSPDQSTGANIFSIVPMPREDRKIEGMISDRVENIGKSESSDSEEELHFDSNSMDTNHSPFPSNFPLSSLEIDSRLVDDLEVPLNDLKSPSISALNSFSVDVEENDESAQHFHIHKGTQKGGGNTEGVQLFIAPFDSDASLISDVSNLELADIDSDSSDVTQSVSNPLELPSFARSVQLTSPQSCPPKRRKLISKSKVFSDGPCDNDYDNGNEEKNGGVQLLRLNPYFCSNGTKGSKVLTEGYKEGEGFSPRKINPPLTPIFLVDDEIDPQVTIPTSNSHLSCAIPVIVPTEAVFGNSRLEIKGKSVSKNQKPRILSRRDKHGNCLPSTFPSNYLQTSNLSLDKPSPKSRSNFNSETHNCASPRKLSPLLKPESTKSSSFPSSTSTSSSSLSLSSDHSVIGGGGGDGGDGKGIDPDLFFSASSPHSYVTSHSSSFPSTNRWMEDILKAAPKPSQLSSPFMSSLPHPPTPKVYGRSRRILQGVNSNCVQDKSTSFDSLEILSPLKTDIIELDFEEDPQIHSSSILRNSSLQEEISSKTTARMSSNKTLIQSPINKKESIIKRKRTSGSGCKSSFDGEEELRKLEKLERNQLKTLADLRKKEEALMRAEISMKEDCYIFIFDSMGGAHNPVIATLKELSFSPDSILSPTPSFPPSPFHLFSHFILRYSLHSLLAT